MKTLKLGLLALGAVLLSASAQAHEIERQRHQHRHWDRGRAHEVQHISYQVVREAPRCAAPAPVVYVPAPALRVLLPRVAVRPGVQVQIAFGL
jgi:hypothetical protein